MSDVQRFIDANLGRFRAELHDFLSIPSVSADPQHDQDTRAAAEWLSSQLTVAGLKSTVSLSLRKLTPARSVSIGPGATQFTRMLNSASSKARSRMKPCTPALQVE